MTNYYQVPETMSGLNLEDLQRKYGGLAGVYGQMFGIPTSTKLQGGQTLTYNDVPGINFGGSTEGGVISKYFTPGISPEQKVAQQKETEMRNILQQGKTEAIGTLESGRKSLKTRYDDLISAIKGTATQRRSEADIATAREYGKRGIPLSSGVYDKAIQQSRLPVDVAEASSLASAGATQTELENAINQAIANIQSSTGLSSAQALLELYKIGEQSKQFGMTFEEGVRQFNENLAFQKSQKPEQQQYVTLGEGSTLYDLLSGKSLFTAPKTYKGTGGGFDEGSWE